MSTADALSPEDFELLENYLNSTLDAVQEKVLEQRLAREPVLQREYERLQKARLAVETGALKKKMDHWHHDMSAGSGTGRIYRWLAIAAGIAALFGLCLWLWGPSQEDALFARHASIDPGLPTPMSAQDQQYDFYDAMVDYKNENYRTALEKWATLAEEQPDNDSLQYFQGAAYFALSEYRPALRYFEQVRQNPQSFFYGRSEWYTALCWLKTDDVEKLHQLAHDSESEYAARIRALSGKIKES